MPLTGYNADHSGLSATSAALLDKFLDSLIKNHTGRNRAIKSVKIEDALEISGSAVRGMVSYLRAGDATVGRAPRPICSDSTGYWFAAAPEEIASTLAHLRQRRNQIDRVIAGLYLAKENLKNGIEMSQQAELQL